MSEWVFSIIYMAAFCAVAMMLTPEGATKKTVGLVCAAAMIIAVISPLNTVNYSDFSIDIHKYKNEAEKLCETAANEEENLNRTFIEDKCKTYIMDKAASCGGNISSLTVDAQWSTDGFWYPETVYIEGSFTSEQKSVLELFMESELGIMISNQFWGE